MDVLNKNINMLSLLVTYTLRWSCLLLKPRISRNIIITGLNNYRVFGVKNPARNTLEEGDIYIFHHHKLGPKWRENRLMKKGNQLDFQFSAKPLAC